MTEIKKVQFKYGDLFGGVSPDIYSSFLLASEANKCIQFDLPFIYHKTVLTNGIGESFLAERIEKWEDSLAADEIKLAYLPSPGMVKLRLTTYGKNEAELKDRVKKAIEKLTPLISEYIYGYEEYGKEPDLSLIHI
mgnify:CR=1 FL=1